MARALLRLPEVLELVPYKRSRLYGLIREGKFPAPVPIGPRIVAWDSEAVAAWIDEQIAFANRRQPAPASSEADANARAS